MTVGLNYLWPEALLGFLLNTIGSTVLVVWTLSLISQIILRRRADRAGEKLPFRMWCFPYLSYFALALIGMIVLLGLADPVVRTQFGLTTGLIVLIAMLCKVFGKRKEAEVLRREGVAIGAFLVAWPRRVTDRQRGHLPGTARLCDNDCELRAGLLPGNWSRQEANVLNCGLDCRGNPDDQSNCDKDAHDGPDKAASTHATSSVLVGDLIMWWAGRSSLG